MPPRENVYFDDFLITAEKNPNTRGAEVLGFSASECGELLDACRDGRVRFLYICHHDLTLAYPKDLVSKSLESLDCVVYQGAFDHATAESARVCLPSAVYAEKAGTFTNMQGRVQRFDAAISPLDQALPDLEIIANLADALSAPLPRGSAEQIFKEIGLQVPAFAGMTYQTLGALGQLLKAG